MSLPFIQSSFSVLKTALPPLIPSKGSADELIHRHQLAIVPGRPAEQRQEVHHRFDQIPPAGIRRPTWRRAACSIASCPRRG